ncbi:MAG: replication-relaxation family protein [Nocardioides sp.]|uniref:replication-relaxation family protein n=1 Tax=Nocardioides sp. TaxID=35761 RepID=UPI0039E51ACF
MTRLRLDHLSGALTERDYRLLRDIEQYRLLTSRQIQRLHFDQAHPTGVAAARACNRALTRLKDIGVLKALQRRVGGVRSGSASFVWYLGAAGERALRVTHPDLMRGRRNYREPSRHFVEHTLAIAEIAVRAIEAQRHGELEVLTIQTEPASWQASLAGFGTTQTLKPDLRLVTASSDYEHHTFIEVDLASEHLPVIVRQCLAYQTHRATGRYQAEHGLYPLVVWVVPTEHRRRQIRERIRTEHQLNEQLFVVITSDQVIELLRDGIEAFDRGRPDRSNEGREQEGGTA